MKNAAKEYCYEKVAPRDSALYYSLRSLKSHQRDSVVAVHAFYREIETIIFECQDHHLALIKFNWWRGEIVKLTVDKSDHPALVLLQKNVEMSRLEKIQESLLKIIDGFEQLAVTSHFDTFEEVVVHWMRTAGERELLLNILLHEKEIISVEMMYQLTMLIEMVHYIQHLRWYIRHDVICFPNDEMQQFNVTQALLGDYVTTNSIKKLLQHQSEKVERAYSSMKELSSKQRNQLSHLMIRCEIAHTVFDEIQKSDFCVLENLIVLTPLRYWWIAFRS